MNMAAPTEQIRRGTRLRGLVLLLVFLSAIGGVLLASGILYITWEHNPQCEFHCDGVVYWSAWLPYGAAAFVIGFVGSAAIGLALLSAVALLRTALHKHRRKAEQAAIAE
jgi:hypothetical protein